MMAAAAGAGAGLIGPLTIAQTAFSVASPILQGIAAKQAGEAAAKQSDINAYIGRTRAMQSDTVSRQNMESELGTARAAIRANQQGGSVGTFELLRDLRETRGRERRIERGSYMQQVWDFESQARNSRRKGAWGIPMGVARAVPSILDLYRVHQAGQAYGQNP
jgi:hypothetical protein